MMAASEIPSLSGEIVGRRGWRVRGGDPAKLESAAVGELWEPGVNAARCLTVLHHPAPESHCHCGLYAYYDAWHPGLLHYGVVHGVITAWGHTELHADGFRAEYARVAALAEHPVFAPDEVVRQLARIYGVPVIRWSEFEDDSFISEYGQIVPRELRPTTPAPDHKTVLVGRAMSASVFVGAAIMMFGRTFWGIALPIAVHLAAVIWKLTRG